MKIWTCNSFTGHWPVGSAAVIVAGTRELATDTLNDQLREVGLPGNVALEEVLPVDMRKTQAIILCDGDY